MYFFCGMGRVKERRWALCNWFLSPASQVGDFIDRLLAAKNSDTTLITLWLLLQKWFPNLFSQNCTNLPVTHFKVIVSIISRAFVSFENWMTRAVLTKYSYFPSFLKPFPWLVFCGQLSGSLHNSDVRSVLEQTRLISRRLSPEIHRRAWSIYAAAHMIQI